MCVKQGASHVRLNNQKFIAFKCIYMVGEFPRPKRHPFDNPAQGSRSVENYIVLPHCLGRGSFAEVHLSMDPNMSRQVACKTVRVQSKDKTAARSKKKAPIDEVLREVKILMKLDHVSNYPRMRSLTAFDQHSSMPAKYRPSFRCFLQVI